MGAGFPTIPTPVKKFHKVERRNIFKQAWLGNEPLLVVVSYAYVVFISLHVLFRQHCHVNRGDG